MLCVKELLEVGPCLQGGHFGGDSHSVFCLSFQMCGA